MCIKDDLLGGPISPNSEGNTGFSRFRQVSAAGTPPPDPYQIDLGVVLPLGAAIVKILCVKAIAKIPSASAIVKVFSVNAIVKILSVKAILKVLSAKAIVKILCVKAIVKILSVKTM
jgi:hypothetical protein